MNKQIIRKLVAVFSTCIFGWALAYLATNVLRNYAIGLFVWLPLVMGATTTIIYGYKKHNNKSSLQIFIVWGFNRFLLWFVNLCI